MQINWFNINPTILNTIELDATIRNKVLSGIGESMSKFDVTVPINELKEECDLSPDELQSLSIAMLQLGMELELTSSKDDCYDGFWKQNFSLVTYNEVLKKVKSHAKKITVTANVECYNPNDIEASRKGLLNKIESLMQEYHEEMYEIGNKADLPGNAEVTFSKDEGKNFEMYIVIE